MNKDKRFMLFGVILLLMSLVGSLGTYAWFTWKSTSNTSLTMTIGKLADVIFTSGNNISTSTLSPVYNYTDGEVTTFSINNKDTTGTTVDYAVKLNITSIATELKNTSLKYVLLKNNTIVQEGDFSTISTGSTTIYSDSISTSGITNYKFYLYIDGNIENNTSMVNKSLVGTITVETVKKESLDAAIETINNLGLEIDTTNTPDFTLDGGTCEEYCDGTNGIYKAEDDLGITYYFRGNVENNYVKFANYYWRIIRINGDGTIRIVYAGTVAHENGYDDSDTKDMIIGESAFNLNYNDNAYVGYMYGTPGSSTYNDTHANINDSTIKKTIDTWYKNNLLSYQDKISDAIYCNDRSLTEGTGIKNTEGYYGINSRLENMQPSYICINKNDKFSVDNNIGNGNLTYPIGLLTMDEIMFSGSSGGDISSSYLYNDGIWWTMTPVGFTNSDFKEPTCMLYMSNRSELNPASVEYEWGIRPVISLKSSVIISGDGTINNPFTVD